MASLEELLAEEGFRGRRSVRSSRDSSKGPLTMSMPLYPFRHQNKTASPSSNRTKTERVRSDLSRYASKGELGRNDSLSSRKPRDNLVRREKEGRSMKAHKERVVGRDSDDMPEGRRLNDNSSEDFQGKEIVEVGVEESEEVIDFYNDKVKRSSESKEKYSRGILYKERSKESSGKDMKAEKRHSNGSKRRLMKSDDSRKSMKQPQTSYDRSNRGSRSKKSFGVDNQKGDNVLTPTSEPALDEVAVQAIVSILSGCIKRFLKDEDFRTALHHNSLSSLNFVELGEEYSTEGKVIANLEKAIETVERAAEESVNSRELKKASILLSVITGLNSDDMKVGSTYGVPNSKLSACAHLYLSVIYKLQKKDRISAKHLLQVFCDSPFIARKTLLPELWDHLFSPHLAHLKEWYNQEADSLADEPSKPRKLKLLEKVYNEILDSGTCQFSIYYKEWLTGGVEVPCIPSIEVPSVSACKLQQGDSFGHSSEVAGSAKPFSQQPMVSKKLYESVFGQLSKPGVDGAEDNGEAETFDTGIRSSDSSIVEVKQTLTYSSEIAKIRYQDIEEDSTKSAQDDVFHLEDTLLLTFEERLRLPGVNDSPERDVTDKVSISDTSQRDAKEGRELCAPPNTKENEQILRRLAKSIFEQQQHEAPADPTTCGLPNTCEYFDEKSFFASIPQDFICPLTGQLFEDPVTLETGQTFEREAFKEWIDQGNRTCPITGKTLECLVVPLTNFILKRIVDGWKLNNCRRLLAFPSQIVEHSMQHGPTDQDETAIFILEQLLTTFSSEDRITNAKHLISLGGLQFLVRRFEFGQLEEKTRVATLLSFCFEANTSCRNQIVRNIDKPSLLELLHSKKVKSRTNAVLLLTELICLSRRGDVSLLLDDLQNEEIVNAMHVLLVFLQSCPPVQRPLVSVLLLHLDLLVEPRKYSIYRDAAVDAIIVALDESLTDEKVREKCCRALLILGGRFSLSGELVTESWILNQAGFNDDCEVNSWNSEKNSFLVHDLVDLDDEEHNTEEWLKNLSASLLGNGRKSFLEAISKSLGSGNLNLVRVCLTTVAWLSHSLSSQSDAKFQLSALSALISCLKETLENGEHLHLKVLASMSLLNFSKIPECRVMLMTIAEEIMVPLQSLAEVTCTAKQLYAIISGEL